MTERWVRDGTRFYLQNRSGDLPLTLENTLATVEVALTEEGCEPARGAADD